MKQIKNAMLAVLGGLLILSVAMVSCKKKSSSPSATITSVSNLATTGTTVTITGTNFSGTASVIIGSTTIQATVVNSTTITFVAPTTAQIGILTVIINGVPFNEGSFTVAVLGPTSDSVATANLVAKWTFDTNGVESISTDGPYKTVGVTYGGAGQIGGCATFSSGYLLFNSIGQIDNDTSLESYSISMWVNIAQSSTDPLRPLFQMTGTKYPNIWGQLDLEITNNYNITGDSLTIGARQHQVDGHDISGSYDHEGFTAVNAGLSTGIANNWIFLTETYNGSGTNQTMQLYLNGNRIDSAQFTDVWKTGPVETFNLVPTGNYPTDGEVPAAKVYIGTMAFFDQGNTVGDGYAPTYAPSWSSSYSWAGEAITGKLDDIRIFNRALTQVEITSLYTYGTQGK